MNIEKDIFKRTSINFQKLNNYGFKKKNNNYILEKNFYNNEFKAIITINDKGIINSKIIDLSMNEEYLGLRIETSGEFINNVRESYKELLIDIRNNCYETNYYIFNQSNRINNYIKKKYHNDPEFLWDKSPGYGVYRNSNNQKWYAILMNIDFSKLEDKSGEIEIINIKLPENKIKNLLKEKGFYKAYHMNKKDWISIILNDTLKDEKITSLLDESYNLVKDPEAWIIPANPKYYDVINCFNNTDEILWKQGSNIHINDIIYLYIASPYSKILYKCKTINVNIPYKYKDKNISMNQAMKLKLLKNLDNKNYTFKYLNSLGITAIRGPRKINKDISNLLE